MRDVVNWHLSIDTVEEDTIQAEITTVNGADVLPPRGLHITEFVILCQYSKLFTRV